MKIEERIRKEVEQAIDRTKNEVIGQLCELQMQNANLHKCCKEYQARLRKKNEVVRELCDKCVELQRKLDALESNV